ncbi:hypothetical protein [Tomitella cavernea]
MIMARAAPMATTEHGARSEVFRPWPTAGADLMSSEKAAVQIHRPY